MAASPTYLARFSAPRTLEELQQHKLLIYTHAHTPNELRFTKNSEERVLTVTSLLDSNDGQVLRAAALDGLGILIQPSYIIHEDIVAGRLVPVLDDWEFPRLNINLASHIRKQMSDKVRAFIDFMVEHFDKMGYERKWTGRFGV
jgi:DNA-binding transcriptional LysR family regulator